MRQSLKKFSRRAGNPKSDVRVEYAANYAIIVHEDLTANHPRGGQAKYLEQPAREFRGEIQREIKINLKRNKTLFESLKAGANFLLALSRPLVPVDTGFLKKSGQVKVRRK